MSFAAGMGAGMGAGIGAGMAMGVAAGKKRARMEIGDYVRSNAISVHDEGGADIDIETFLANAIDDRPDASRGGKLLLVTLLLLLGLAMLGVCSYLFFF